MDNDAIMRTVVSNAENRLNQLAGNLKISVDALVKLADNNELPMAMCWEILKLNSVVNSYADIDELDKVAILGED